MVKIKKKTVIMASSMKEIPASFWDWFFDGTECGDSNIIEVVPIDEEGFSETQLQTVLIIANKYKKYTYKENGIEYLEIENDL